MTPEEAEAILPIVRGSGSPTFLMTYAAPVTRRMLHFNNLKYYSIPALPESWCAPQWLTTELGFFAGRLYFEWSEYGSICRLLGIDEYAPVFVEEESSEGDGSDQMATSATESGAEMANMMPAPAIKGQENGDKHDRTSSPKQQQQQQRTKLTHKPFTFTQDYLSVRRRGQEISHTPMGFLCMGKPLHEDHAFFRAAESAKPKKKGLTPVSLAQADGADEGRVEGAMEVGEYDPSAALRDDEEHEEIEYDEAEFFDEDEEENEEEEEEECARPRSGAARNGRHRGSRR